MIRWWTALRLMAFSLPSPASFGVEWDERVVAVPIADDAGDAAALQTKLCLPKGAKKAFVAILNHGSPALASKRPTLAGFSCKDEPVQWFLAKGYLVALPIRRGYGATKGAWAEDYGSCRRPDFFRAGLETAKDIAATVAYVTKLPEARDDQVTVVGQSAGGWGTVAYASLPHPKVAALINMAGGRGGGHPGGGRTANCDPAALARAAGQYGSTATTPMLWIYSENDAFFAPPLAKSLHDAFTKAGGAAQFVLTPPFGKDDGHHQFGGPGGSGIWGPYVDDYLNKRLTR